jgi:hypothetical protein
VVTRVVYWLAEQYAETLLALAQRAGASGLVVANVGLAATVVLLRARLGGQTPTNCTVSATLQDSRTAGPVSAQRPRWSISSKS